MAQHPVIYNQYEHFFLDESVGHLSYRRVFGILAELEQAGILASKKEAGDRGGYNKQYMLTIPAETAKILDEKQLQLWKSIKESRFNHLYNPRGKGNSYQDKVTKYENQKTWKKVLGEYDDPEQFSNLEISFSNFYQKQIMKVDLQFQLITLTT